MRKIWDIHGGVHPPENKTQSNQTPIARIALPEKLVLPLNQHIGAPAIACVSVGEPVKKGQKIADAQGLVSAPVHAPTSGIITSLDEQFIPHSSGMKAPCIEIKPDGKEEWIELEADENYLELDKLTLVEKIRNAGIAGMGGAGFPSAVKLNPRADNTIDTLILNGTECEPYITADDVLMRERADEIIAGALLLAHLLGNPKEIVVGIEDNKPESISAMQKAAQGTAVEIAVFPTKYPSGGEKQLIQILTGKEVPSGKLPAQIGIVLQNVGTAQAAYRAVRYGEPLISRVTTVVGESLKTQQNIDVLLGTPIQHILEQHGYQEENNAQLIIGGPMMGFAMEHTDIPVIKTTNCVLVPSKAEMPAADPAQACIRCGMCAEACPATLLPQQLYWYSQNEDFDKLESHNLFDCIECGACSFVCPSNIPLVQYYRASKGTIRQLEQEKQKSDHSRKRFEFRQERIARAEAEKEAKRQARKKAAEEAKKKLEAEKNSAAKVASSNTDTAAPKIDTEKELAKLERALSSAENRVGRATEQLEKARNDGAEAEKIQSLEDRLKQAQQKVKDAELKLKEFKSSPSKATPKPDSKSDGTDPAKELAKLERALSSAENRVGRAKDQLEKANTEGVDADKVQSLQDRLQQAQQKVKEAETKLAEFKSNAASANSPGTSTSTTGAKEVAAKAIDPEKELAKLERAVSSADNRVDRAKDQIEKAKQEDSGEDRIKSLEARLKQAEQKAKEAKAKLEEFQTQQSSSNATSDADKSAEKINEKIALSPFEQQQKTVDTLKKRIQTAKEKVQEAEQSGATTVEALKLGVEKLTSKLEQAEKELAELSEDTPSSDNTLEQKTRSAADIAIEKAKAKAEALANMSEEEKAQAQIESLKERLTKAQTRLDKALEEGNEHVDAFRNGVDKLKKKLEDAEAEFSNR